MEFRSSLVKIEEKKLDRSGYLKLGRLVAGHLGPISMKCPFCSNLGMFVTIEASSNDIIAMDSINTTTGLAFGHRMCPNELCRGHVFTIVRFPANTLERSFPQELISFDTNNIPQRIVDAFSEALIWHSQGCFIASAIMIRKVLEELAEEKSAQGSNLMQRLKDLAGKILIPKALIDGMDMLRLLGNDAAHIEAKTFEQIEREEIEISIEFTKEILKATYQYESLLTKLASLKKQPKDATL